MKKSFEEIVLEKLDKIDLLESRFDSFEKRFDSLEGRFDSLEGRFDSLEKEVHHLKVLHEDTDAKIEHIIEVFAPTIEKVENLDICVRRLEAAS